MAKVLAWVKYTQVMEATAMAAIVAVVPTRRPAARASGTTMGCHPSGR